MSLSFQYTSSEASDELTTSTACTLALYSWLMRCSRRSAPLRSTLHCTPGYLASKALPICSDSLRSIEVYQTTLPSFLAASISAGVTALGGGAADSTRVENDAPAASAPEPINRSRRENFERFMRILPELRLFVLSRPRLADQRPAFFRRQVQPDSAALREALAGGGDDPQLRAALELRPYSPGWRRERPAASPSPVRRSPPAAAVARIS